MNNSFYNQLLPPDQQIEQVGTPPLIKKLIEIEQRREKQIKEQQKHDQEKNELSNHNFSETQKRIKEQMNRILLEIQPTPPENLHIHPDEKLKRIPGFLVHYANRKGEIWEWRNNDFHLLPQIEGSNHYYTVRLTAPNGRRRGFPVHRLICSTFHGEMPARSYCCHRNDIRSDNRADNLYWGNPLTNVLDYHRNKTNPDYIETRTREQCRKASRLLAKVKAYLNSRMEEVTEEAIIKEIERRAAKSALKNTNNQ